MWPNPAETADMVAFTLEILDEKLNCFVQWDSETEDSGRHLLCFSCCEFPLLLFFIGETKSLVKKANVAQTVQGKNVT